MNAASALHHRKNLNQARESRLLRKKLHPEMINVAQYRWQKANPEKVRMVQKRSREKIRGTVRGRLNAIMGTVICNALHGRKHGRRWENLVGFTLDQLKKHIEKRFTEGMTWERSMKGDMHIDHKIPKAAFNFECPEDIDFRRCWSLKNLQPMWAIENMKKRDKVDRPFQPSLTI